MPIPFLARAILVACLAFLAVGVATAQEGPRPSDARIESIGDGLLRVGSIRIDLRAREITIPGVVNPAEVLEFVANTKGGYKAYESAITLETDAPSFNLACILIGLDVSRSVPPTRHFDPKTPQGDPVEVWVEWQDGARTRKVRAEDLLYNDRSKETLAHGPWVYTGSVFVRDGRYLAEVHGVLIGFVHSPAPIIESPQGFGLAAFGSIKVNPALNLAPGTAVRLSVKALPLAR